MRKNKNQILEEYREIRKELEEAGIDWREYLTLDGAVGELRRRAEGKTSEADPELLGALANHILDGMIQEIQDLGKGKGSVLREIIFREAGVGLMWNEARPETLESVLESDYSRTFIRSPDPKTKAGLAVYAYYPTLSEALRWESKRLREKR
jgi:hypothetical protein